MARHEREFQFRGFRVAVPQSILKRWAAVPAQEKCRIIDSASAAYAMQNIKWKCARVQPCVLAKELVAGEQMPTAAQIFHDFSNQRRWTPKKLTIAEAKARVLLLIQFRAYRN